MADAHPFAAEAEVAQEGNGTWGGGH
jgi:hypothetical protein